MRTRSHRLALSLAALVLPACTPRASIPPPRTPLVATPDAPFRAHLPPLAPSTARTIPAVQDFTLPNGMRVLLIERADAPMVTARFVSRRGGDEAGNPAGLARLTIDAMLDGTQSHPGTALFDALEAHGIILSEGLSPDAGGLRARFLATETEAAISLLGEAVLAPTFPADALDVDINRLVTSRLEGGGLATVSAELALASLYGPDNPYGRPAEGFARTLRAFGRNDVVAFYRSHYVPAESALVVVGGTTRAALEPIVTRVFGAWPARPSAPQPAPALYAPHPGPRFILMHSYRRPQSEIVIALRAPSENSPDAPAAALLTAGLGGMFSSRLNRELRERQGYTYGVHASLQQYRESGVVLIRCSVSTDDTVRALREILAMLRRVRHDGLDEAELAAARTLAREEAETVFETDGGASGALAGMFVYGHPTDYYATLGARVESVSADDVRRVANSVLDLDAARVAVGGDKYEIESGLRGLGIGNPEVYVSDRRQ